MRLHASLLLAAGASALTLPSRASSPSLGPLLALRGGFEFESDILASGETLFRAELQFVDQLLESATVRRAAKKPEKPEHNTRTANASTGGPNEGSSDAAIVTSLWRDGDYE